MELSGTRRQVRKDTLQFGNGTRLMLREARLEAHEETQG